ncbi:MAG: 50S ribosomal protein L10 [Chloroflexi bacterium]|nr:50S ribosomal protein L10 [Chloroflexota bacterium]
MTFTKQEKEERIVEILEQVKKSQVVFVTNYQGMTTKQTDSLRGKLKKADCGYRVVKNTLAARALKDAGLPVPDKMFDGPVGLGFAYSDIAASAKAFGEFAREADKFQMKGAILGQQVIEGKAAIERLASMPTLPQARAQLIGLISAPASRLAGVIASGVRQVVNVVKAYADKENAPATA